MAVKMYYTQTADNSDAKLLNVTMSKHQQSATVLYTFFYILHTFKSNF